VLCKQRGRGLLHRRGASYNQRPHSCLCHLQCPGHLLQKLLLLPVLLLLLVLEAGCKLLAVHEGVQQLLQQRESVCHGNQRGITLLAFE
jgi:hypothetical protein